MNIQFDKIYVIQSLDPTDDEMTGEFLFNDVLQYFNAKYPDKNAELIKVDTPSELLEALNKIKIECETRNIKPIIHFEIHGLEDKTGLSLNNGDISWDGLYSSLTKINDASKWNLFITMAVCFGNYAMLLIKPTKPAPFTGILGSFESIYEDDLYIKYSAFYSELLNSLDFEKALEQLHLSNPSLPTDYRYINAEKTFKNVYQKYFDTQFSEDIIRKRFNTALKAEGISFTDREKKNRFQIQFKVTLLKTKQHHFENDKTKFFMFDKFPEHRHIYCVGWTPNYR